MSEMPALFRYFGSERSYFSGKARPAFRAKRVHFEEILPAPLEEAKEFGFVLQQ